MKFIVSLAVITLGFILPQKSFSQTAGPGSPTDTGNQPLDYCTTCSGAIWKNTGSIRNSDSQYSTVKLTETMTCYHDSCYLSRYLTSNNFGFSVPSSALITGIELKVEGFTDAAVAVMDYGVQLTQGIALIGNNMASTAYWTTSDSIRSYGDASSLWGCTLAPANVNNPGFGVYIKVVNTSSAEPTVYVDQVTLTIYYALGTSILSQTQSSGNLQVTNQTGNLAVSFRMPEEENTAMLTLYSINGEKHFASQIESRPGEISGLQIPAESLASGIYFVQVSSGEQVFRKKMVVLK
jgi:hypothetical protein